MELTPARVILFIILETIWCGITCFPLNKNGYRWPVRPTSEQISFMQKYGYLDDGQPEFAAQYTQDTIVEALLNIQKYGAIEQTGILDEQTIELMKKRRCGVKDIFKMNERRKRFVLKNGWEKRIIKYSVLSWAPQLGEEAVKSEVKRALDMWAAHGKITFIPTDDSPDIKVSFHSKEHGDKSPFDGPGNVLAHAFFPYVDNGGDAHFDNEEYWSLVTNYEDEENDTTGFFSVAVHELGHTLGIGHSDTQDAIMFPYYTESEPKDLHEDDIAAIQKLYITMLDENPLAYTSATTEVTPTPHQDIYTTMMPHRDIDTTPYTEIEYTPPSTRSYTRTTVETATINDICDSYDTIAVLRGELFVFKDEFIWRYKTRGILLKGYPINMHKLFPKLPKSLNKIDAVYEMKNGSIVFFYGFKQWLHDDDTSVYHTFDNYKLPRNTSVDAAMLWSVNNKTYVFKGDEFWRYDKMDVLDEGYPKSIARWKGIPSDIDAAIQWTDDMTYFFKGPLYWRFNNILIQTESRYPLPTPQVWFGCPETNMVFEHVAK